MPLSRTFKKPIDEKKKSRSSNAALERKRMGYVIEGEEVG